MSKSGFCDTVMAEGNILNLLGIPGSGKTNGALFLAEKSVDVGFFVYTNIKFFKFEQIGEACARGYLPKGVTYRRLPPEIITVTSLSQLLICLLHTEKNVAILDESSMYANSTSPLSKRTQEIKKLSYLIRHLRSCELLIAQSMNSIPPALRAELVTYQLRIRKISQTNRMLIIQKAQPYINDMGEEDVKFEQVGEPIERIPLTRLPWDGFFFPKFKFDVTIDDASDALGEYDSLEVRRKDPQGITLGEKVIQKLLDSSKDKKDDEDSGEEKKINFWDSPEGLKRREGMKTLARKEKDARRLKREAEMKKGEKIKKSKKSN